MNINKINKRGGIALQILIFLVIVVLSSATILFLVKTGVISVNQEYQDVDVLNTEFMPSGREGNLAIRNFQFCGYVGNDYECVIENNEFYSYEDVYFVFDVESTVMDGYVSLIQNYRILDPNDNVLLEAGDREDYTHESQSTNSLELVKFNDFFTLGSNMGLGEYKLELIVENPLINKQTKLIRKFVVGEDEVIEIVDDESEEFYHEN